MVIFGKKQHVLLQDHKWTLLLCISIISFIIIKWPAEKTLPIWDESVYLAMGKYLYSAGNSGLWESIRPIGLPVITGFFWIIGGIEWQTYLSSIFMLLVAAATLMMTYLIAEKLYNALSGILAVVLLTISPIFFHHSALVLTDIISTLFVLLAVYFYISDYRYKFFFMGLFSTLAAMFRFPHGILMIFFLILLIVEASKKNAEYKHKGYKDVAWFFSGFIVALPFFIFNYITYSPYTANAFDAIFRPIILGSLHQGNPYQAVPGLWQNILYYVKAIILANPLFLLAFFSIFHGNKKIKRKKNENRKNPITIIYIIILIYLCYLIYIANKQERFLLMVLPLFAILSSGLIIRSMHDKHTVWKRLRYTIVASLLVCSVLFNIYSLKNPYYDNGPVAYDASIGLYTYYNNYNITLHDKNTVVLTTDPLFAVYSDNLFLPFYDIVGRDAGQSIYLNEWESEYDFDAIVYTPSSFPCMDEDCEEKYRIIYQYFSERYILEDKRTLSGREYYLFRK